MKKSKDRRWAYLIVVCTVVITIYFIFFYTQTGLELFLYLGGIILAIGVGLFFLYRHYA